MKLQNKKTLKVVDVEIKSAFYKNIAKIKLKDKKTGAIIAMYKSLAELNDEWQDYKEPKGIQGFTTQGEDIIIRMGSIKEAEKAVEKLKAWTRLKEKGAMFKGWFWDKCYGTCIIIGDSECDCIDDGDDQNKADLDLLFSGEDN